jgi:putative DNA-invertase from lambdoid prophage Rac
LFAYARVSTNDQITENQREEIAAAGYAVAPARFVEEKVSGSVQAMQRPAFARLMDKLEEADTLVVTKIDRIGRDSIDVQTTVRMFADRGIRLVVLQLGNLDLTSTAGALIVKVLAAMGDFERSLIIERTKAGQDRARAQGKHMGRPVKTTEDQRQVIREALAEGKTVSSVARQQKLSRATIISIRDTAAGSLRVFRGIGPLATGG